MKKQIHPFVDETDLHILLTLGNGNMTEGVRICVAWAQHFYNIGLRDDLNLDHIGLAVRVNPKLTMDWEDWEALKNAHRTDLNGFLDDFLTRVKEVKNETADQNSILSTIKK